MKKMIVFIVLCIYGFGSFGATVHYHYCMDEFVGWNLVEKENSKCGKCGMKEDASKKGCCKDEHKEYKITADYKKGGVADYVKVFFSSVLINEFQVSTNVKPVVAKLCYSNYHPPPDIFIQNWQVLYCTFLI